MYFSKNKLDIDRNSFILMDLLISKIVKINYRNKKYMLSKYSIVII